MVGGRLEAFLPQREAISCSQFILRIVRRGYLPGFSKPPTNLPRLHYEISERCRKGQRSSGSARGVDWTKYCKPCTAGESRQELLLPRLRNSKPSGKFRLILHLKLFNLSVTYKRFGMDSIFSVKALLLPNGYMASIDLKDAYLHIPKIGSKNWGRNNPPTAPCASILAYPPHPGSLQRSWQKPWRHFPLGASL